MGFEEALKKRGIEICGPAERETTEQVVEIVGGKPVPTTVWKRFGLCKYIDNGQEMLADRATFIDWGPRLGISAGFTRHKDVEPTEAEREAGRRRIREIATRALIDQGIW